MAQYLIRTYDRNGRLIRERIEQCSSEVGRWKQNVKLDAKDGYKSRYKSVPTKTGLNRKVVSYSSYRKDGTLDTTASLIRNSDRGYRKGYK